MNKIGRTESGDFLGRGWAFPPAFTPGGSEIEMVSGHEEVHQSLLILLGTQPGERVMQPEFGCDLLQFVFEEAGQNLINEMTGVISDAILYHEPRITLDQLQIEESSVESGLLLINLFYTVRGSNSRFNLVYPFYLNESAVPDSSLSPEAPGHE